ncbi:MAG: Ig-like domain repeat protein [Nitratireductor sp.]
MATDGSCNATTPSRFGLNYSVTATNNDTSTNDPFRFYLLDTNGTVLGSSGHNWFTSLTPPTISSVTQPQTLVTPAAGPFRFVLHDDTDFNANFADGETFDATGLSILADITFDANALDSDCPKSPNTAPVITGGATAAVNAAENQTAVTDVQSTDDSDSEGSGNGLTYAFSTDGGRGADNGLFNLDASTGVVTFKTPRDFEDPDSTNVPPDNIYDVQITVSDDGSPRLTATQDITVTVTDVDEIAPTLTPELDVRNNADDADIDDGSTTPTYAAGTQFNTTYVGYSTSNTFRVENNGGAVLNLGTDAVSISDTTNFTITNDLTNSGTIAAGDVETFTIRFNPQTGGGHTATVTIRSDDANEDPYTFTVSGGGQRLPQSINFTPPADQTLVVNGTVTVTANGGSSGEPVTFASNSTNICTVTGSVATMLAIGTCSITASQAGNDQYYSASDVTASFVIGKASQTISFTPPADQAYAANSSVALSATGGASGNAVTFAVTGDTNICSVSGTSAVLLNSGTCEITASQAGNDQYSAANDVLQSFSIGKAAQSITMSASAVSIEISQTSNVSATIGAGTGAIIYSITSGASSCSLSGTVVTGVAEGSCTITATKAEDDKYFSTSDSTSIAVAKASTTLALASSNPTPRLGDVVTYTATITSVVNPTGTVTFNNGGTAICSNVTISANTATCDHAFKTAGNHSISANYSGDIATVASSSTNIDALVEDTIGKTEEIVRGFVTNRALQILNNQNSFVGFITGTNIQGGGPAGNLQLKANSDGYNVSFSTSRSKLLSGYAQANNNDSFVKSTANTNIGFNNFTSDNNINAHANDNLSSLNSEDGQEFNGIKSRAGTYDIWTQLHGSRTNSGDVENSTWVAYVGSHYFINKNSLLGVVGQIDWTDEKDTSSNSSADGRGWMVGPYIAGKLSNQNLYYEARSLWGRSKNNVSPDGTYIDEFNTTRWMASGALSGQYVSGEFTFSPTISASYFEESQEAYTDSLNNDIAGQTISMGEIKFGPIISRKIKIEDAAIGTMIGVSGVYNFGMTGTNGSASSSASIGNETLRARFDAGLTLTDAQGISLRASGFYDGFGVDDYSSYGGTIKILIPLK